MKYFIFMLFFLSLLTQVKSQRDFSLTDTTFELGKSINCSCIYFEFDKATIKPESYMFLDSIVTFLNSNPTIKLEIQNHSDTRVSSKYSTNLTQKRAQSVMQYLVSKGIEEKRLMPKGYLDTKPLISEVEIAKMIDKNDQEASHQKNRRTVFVIIGK